MERDENGKFVKGNKGGPGRMKKEREEKYYDITVTTVTFEQWKRIVTKAAQQAERGDHVARKWLSDYLQGAPVQKIAPVTPDGENPYMEIDRDEIIALARKIADAGNPE